MCLEEDSFLQCAGVDEEVDENSGCMYLCTGSRLGTRKRFLSESDHNGIRQ